MSIFRKLLGVKKNETPSTTEAIQKLQELESMLLKKQELLEKKIEFELGIVKKNGTKNKRTAILALKKKKLYEKQLQQVDGTLSTIEMQRETLESAVTNSLVVQTIKVAANAFESVQDLDPEEVHNLMDDIAEQRELTDEITEAISTPVSFGSFVDEEDLMKELEEIEQEELDKKLLSTEPTTLDFDNIAPVQHQDLPVIRLPESNSEEDLRQLQEWAS